MEYRPDQTANDWMGMFRTLYHGTQNYAKTPYEIHAHLTEVCGIFAKHYFKRRDIKEAKAFIPKIFAWATALTSTLSPHAVDLEHLILRKYPRHCPYCGERPCRCWQGEKPTLAPEQVNRLYAQLAPDVRRTLNDFQVMFREIYGSSWTAEPGDPVERIYVRLTEELAEIGEAVRFHHLYPGNLENELADFYAWWFALVTCSGTTEGEVPLADEVMWLAYPGFCPNCEMLPCYCRPGPVRALMSRPAPGQDHQFDAMTSTFNQGAFKRDLADIACGKRPVQLPMVCARVDVDNFRDVNTNHEHAAGDEALKQIASILRQKVRERDRVYRAGGDEFAVFFFDFTEDEAAGALRRAVASISQSPVRWVGVGGAVEEFHVSVSVGVAECTRPDQIEVADTLADRAAYQSKELGRSRVTRASEMTPQSAPDPMPT